MSNKFILINRDQLFVILVHPVGHAFYARHSQGQIWQLTFGLPTIVPSSNVAMSGNDKAVARHTRHEQKQYEG